MVTIERLDTTERSLAMRAGFRAFGQELRHDAVLYGLIAVYCGVALAVGLTTGSAALNIAIYLPTWIGILVLLCLAWLAIVDTLPAVRASPRRPLLALAQRARARITPRLAAGTMLYLALSLFYGAFTLIKSALPAFHPFSFDAGLADLDAALHLGHDPWRILHPVMGHQPVTRGIEIIYGAVWGYLLFLVPLLICSARRLSHLRVRFVLSLIVAWVLLGNLAAGAFLSGGPAYYGHFTGDHDRFAPLLDYLSFSRGMPQSAIDYQDYLWSWFTSGQPGPGTGISAFPSIHLATATLLALAAGAISRLAGLAGAAFVLVILAGSVHLGWHYAIDGYVSILATCAIWFAMGRLTAQKSTASPLRSQSP